jgi:hypothetical protein
MVGKDDGRDTAMKEAVMAPRRRMKKLAVLVDSTPEILQEVIGVVLRETVTELQTNRPRAAGRIARDIRRHRRADSHVRASLSLQAPA